MPGTLDCLNGICPISLDNNATITQGDQITHYVGYAILEKGFYAYNLLSDSSSAEEGEHGPDRLLAFGGTEYTLSAGKLYSFGLSDA